MASLMGISNCGGIAGAANQGATVAVRRVRPEAPWRMYWPGPGLLGLVPKANPAAPTAAPVPRQQTCVKHVRNKMAGLATGHLKTTPASSWCTFCGSWGLDCDVNVLGA